MLVNINIHEHEDEEENRLIVLDFPNSKNYTHTKKQLWKTPVSGTAFPTMCYIKKEKNPEIHHNVSQMAL